ncbi:MAG: hypothetical protein EA375_05295 [Acholeplasmataceae bacterium]|nr:MAG: hypothetical protein EA375_05295 [Acholeplasmataceae bacterium]
MNAFFDDMLSCLETSCFDKKAEDHVPSYLSIQDDSPFMTLAALEDVMDRLELDARHRRVLLDARDAILRQPTIHALIKFLRHVIIGVAHPSHWLVKGAPLLKQGDVESSAFALMALLALVPASLETHRAKGIDPVHADFNLGHLKGYIKQHHDKHGTVGVENFGWCTYLASLGLIKLGCLQFMHHVFTDRFRLYRHRQNQALCAIAEAGVTVRTDGQFDGINGVSQPAFTTTLTCDERRCKGHRVNPCGSIEKETTTLDLKHWQLVIRKDDPVIDFHIPSKSAYGVDDIKQAFNLAKTFFNTHYPEYDYQAFWCVSWLYSPQLPWFIRKPTSNILNIARQGYVLPATPGQESLFTFVFQHASPDLDKHEPRSSLERDVIAFVKQGGRINAGLYLYGLQDIDRFGTRPYVTPGDEKAFMKLPHMIKEETTCTS